MGSAGLSSLQKEGIRDTKSARRDEFEGEITAALSGLNLTGEQITDITDRARTIHLLTNDLRLIDRFITHYNQIKVSFCSTNDEQNDIYTRGTVTLVHNNSKQYDTCSADKTKVVQNVCTGVRLDANSPSETDCSYGCDKGACKKGAINGTKWVNSDTNPVEFANGVVHANVDFYLEVDTSAVQPDTNEVITFGWKAKYNQGN